MTDGNQEVKITGEVTGRLTVSGTLGHAAEAPQGDVERIPVKDYFHELHARVMHVQNLQNFITNVISTLAVALVGVLVGLMRIGDTDIRTALRQLFPPAYVILVLTLLWAQWVSIYQAFATFKLVRILEQVERDRGPRDLNLAVYFAQGGGRRFLYASLHGLPTIYLVTAPVLVYSFSGDYMTGAAKALLLGGTLAATAGVFVVGFCAMRKAVYHVAGPFAKFKARA